MTATRYDKMRYYCLGFAFMDPDTVLLVRKDRGIHPGMINGYGGKVEYNESPFGSMVREFQEETGIVTKIDDWKTSAFLTSSGGHPDPWWVYVFRTMVGKSVEVPVTSDAGDPCVMSIDDVVKGSFKHPNNSAPWTAKGEPMFAPHVRSMILLCRDQLLYGEEHTTKVTIQHQYNG